MAGGIQWEAVRVNGRNSKMPDDMAWSLDVQVGRRTTKESRDGETARPQGQITFKI